MPEERRTSVGKFLSVRKFGRVAVLAAVCHRSVAAGRVAFGRVAVNRAAASRAAAS